MGQLSSTWRKSGVSCEGAMGRTVDKWGDGLVKIQEEVWGK